MRKDIEAALKADIERAKANCENEITTITEDAKRRDEEENHRKIAQSLYSLYITYIEVGFTEEQAWELVKSLVEKGVK